MSDVIRNQEKLAQAALEAADLCESRGNHANAMHFIRLAATHLELAARLVPHKRGIPTDVEARKRIATAYRAVLDLIMSDSRSLALRYSRRPPCPT